jgi:hypothetical protein
MRFESAGRDVGKRWRDPANRHDTVQMRMTNAELPRPLTLANPSAIFQM